jgi:GH18 family chitinase
MTRIAVFLPEYATSVEHVPRLDIASIPGDRITDLIYCFAGFDAQDSTFLPTWPNPHDAESGPRHNTGQLALLKARYPALNIVMSIGGWYNSYEPGSRAAPCFSAVASTPASRQTFVQRLWCKHRRSAQEGVRERNADHAARTAFLISGAVLSLMRSFPSLN